ncbi:MAG: Rho termination factor N-terminal domain-containing protein, partial [Solirubrobacterales bacterium]
MANGSLENKHIADLHELAAERGIEGFRMLSRDELIDKLGGSGQESGSDRPSGAPAGGGRGGSDRGRSRRGQSERGGRRRGSGRSSREDSDRDEEETEADQPGEPITGVLEVTSRGHGFIRPEDPDAEGDIYVSPSQIRRCEL